MNRVHSGTVLLQWKRAWSLGGHKGVSHGNRKNNGNGNGSRQASSDPTYVCFPTLAIEMLSNISEVGSGAIWDKKWHFKNHICALIYPLSKLCCFLNYHYNQILSQITTRK